MNKKGVTLVELIIVVAIIGILAMVAIPAYIGQQRNAARTEAYSNLQNLRLLEEQYYAENGCYYMNTSSSCTNATVSGVTNIQNSSFLPGFKPGDTSALNFDYSISTFTVSSLNAGGFRATAAGKSGRRVSRDTFWIDYNNSRNF